MISFLALALVVPLAENQPISLDGELVHPRNLFVKIEASAKRLLHKQELEVIQVFDQIGYVLVRAPQSRLQLTRRNLRALPGVIDVGFDRAARLAFEPNDPYFPSQWSLPAMNVPSAWDLSMGSAEITVAVIDTGVNVNHADLVNNVWTNPGEVPANGVDDDGNGYVDDVHGYNFSYNNSEPIDYNGHGTACSSIIAATQNNGLGIAGVAPAARIMAIKAALDSGYFYDSATVPAYIYAADNGARIFSCSFYADGVSQAEHDAIRYAVSQGVLPIVAAGNDYSVIPYYPGAYDEVIGVAALRNVGGTIMKSTFSNYGSWVDVAAPGTSIHVARAGGGYFVGSGTSFACPNTAGVAALLWSAKPTASAAEIRSAIEDTATNMYEAPYGEFANYGAVNALSAMQAILGYAQPVRNPAVRYMSPVGYRRPNSKARVLSRIFGRGFEDGEKIVVRRGHRHLPIKANDRTFIDFYNVGGPEPVTVYVDGALVATLPQLESEDYSYPLIEASTKNGAVVNGGYFETLLNDASVLDCTSRNDYFIRMEGTFTRVSPADSMILHLTRNYTGTILGTETERVYLYDWSSSSYPYGTWIEISARALPQTMTTSDISVSDFSRFVDFDGWVYMLVQTSGNHPSVVGHFDQINLGY